MYFFFTVFGKQRYVPLSAPGVTGRCLGPGARKKKTLQFLSIHNGALLIAADEFYWAVMSPREQEEYVRVNTTS